MWTGRITQVENDRLSWIFDVVHWWYLKGYNRKYIPQVELDKPKLFWPEYMRRGRVRIWMLMWNTLAAPSDGEGKRRSLNRGSLRLIDITFSQFTPWTILSQYLPLPLTNFTSVFFTFSQFTPWTILSQYLTLPWQIFTQKLYGCWFLLIPILRFFSIQFNDFNEPTNTSVGTAEAGHLVKINLKQGFIR